MQYFNIQVASQLSGVASATIRAWEKRYNAVEPQRADNKHRLYSEKDIEKLALLYKLTELGQSIGKVARLDLEQLKTVYSTLLHRPYEEKFIFSFSQASINHEKVLTSLLLALEAYKIDIISHEFDKARSQMSPRELCLKILIPLFHRIGCKVEKGELSIAQEHTLSALVSFHLGQMIGQHYQKDFIKDELIIMATPEGELHGIGILASALLCIHHGIKFIFMGTNLPAISLGEAAIALKCKAIILGVTRDDLNEKQSVGAYLSELRSVLPPRTQVWLGGELTSSTKAELEKKKIQFFPTLAALDQFLEKF